MDRRNFLALPAVLAVPAVAPALPKAEEHTSNRPSVSIMHNGKQLISLSLESYTVTSHRIMFTFYGGVTPWFDTFTDLNKYSDGVCVVVNDDTVMVSMINMKFNEIHFRTMDITANVHKKIKVVTMVCAK